MAASKKSTSARKGSTKKKASAKGTGPVREGVTRKSTSAPAVKAGQEQKVGDSTVRASLKPSGAQPGPSLGSDGKTTDTRGSSEGPRRAKPDETPRHRGAEEQVPTPSDTAGKQPIRQTDLPLGHEIHEIDGEKVEVVAFPERVDPVELPPHKRDTLLKDTLRHEGEEGRKLADAPVRHPKGGDWLPVADERTPNDL